MGERRPRGQYRDDLNRAAVAESFVPGVSVASVARRQGLNNNLVFNWRKDARYQPDRLLAERPDDVFLPVTIDQAQSLSVPLVDEEDTPMQAPHSVAQPHGKLTIEIGRSTRLTLDGSFDSKAVCELIRALRTTA